MIVMNNDGDIFDERRKNARRQKQVEVSEERRVEQRRKKDINSTENKDSKD